MASSKAAQEFVPVREIKDGIIVTPDGGMRAILLTSSINFDLKSADVQQAIIMQFQNFLNSLDFSIQIFLESRRLNIAPYLTLLEERHKAQTIDLMKIQTREYIEFIRTFIEGSNIMTKSFFVVVPYTPAILDIGGGNKGLMGKIPKLPAIFGRGRDLKAAAMESEKTFAENRLQLEQRIAIVMQGLQRTGVRAVMLGTEEVVELLYRIMNPADTEQEIPKVG